MIEGDVQLIERILSGDDTAFTALVQKHQKSVHALAWRKIGDFHHAEEITQDTFLRVYKKLSTLKDPHQFSGWLYVITSRCCINWRRNNKSVPQSLETTNMAALDKSAYSRYVSQEQEAKASEHRYDIVKRLLQKLPESERTVMTLYYLGEMTTREISKFLGVSVNTISSRLYRARKRLQQNEERLIHEILGNVQLSESLSDTITQEAIKIKPSSPSTGKPILPWVALGAATVLAVLLLGVSNQYLARFQKPYSFDAASEPTIEIIEAPIVIETNAKPSIRNQPGRDVTTPNNTTAGTQGSQTLSTSDASIDSPTLSAAQWVQSTGPQSGLVYDIFAAANGTLYAFSPTGIYRLMPNAQAWTHLNTVIPIEGLRAPMAEHRNTLYLVSKDAVFTSTDSGETWRMLCSRPKGRAVGFIVSDTPQATRSEAGLTMYLALPETGVFRSTNAGKQWKLLKNGLTKKRVYTVASIGNRVFAGTNDGLYQLNADTWQQSSLDAIKTTQSFKNKTSAVRQSGFYARNSGTWEQIPTGNYNAIYSVAASKNNLYAAVSPDLFTPKSSESNENVLFIVGDPKPTWIFRSTDFGESWTDITPKGERPFFSVMDGVKLLAAGNTLFVQGTEIFRSTDTGETWTYLGMIDENLVQHGSFRSVTVNEQTFYAPGNHGIYRTTDAGESWHTFMDGMVGTGVQRLISHNNQLYAHTNIGILQSIDAGESWQSVRIVDNDQAPTPEEKSQEHINFPGESRLIADDAALYGITPVKNNLPIFRLDADGNAFTRVQNIPTLDKHTLSPELVTTIAKAERIHLTDDMEKDKWLRGLLRSIAVHVKPAGFAVSNGTFYVEYKRMLFKWKHGDPQWTNTGLIDLSERLPINSQNEMILAASGETVYVGKRNGTLFQSLDGANNWKDITPSLPLRYTYFNEIVFAGSTVYVATDTGVLASQTGEHWRVLTDNMGERPIIDRLAINGTTIYGVGDKGSYRLNTNQRWEQITPNIPDKVVSLSVHNDRLYIATQQHGIFHIPLPENTNNTASHQ